MIFANGMNVNFKCNMQYDNVSDIIKMVADLPLEVRDSEMERSDMDIGLSSLTNTFLMVPTSGNVTYCGLEMLNPEIYSARIERENVVMKGMEDKNVVDALLINYKKNSATGLYLLTTPFGQE